MRKLILICLLFAACGKAPATDDFSDLTGLDEKSDSFSSRMKITGNLTYSHSTGVRYTKTPRYRGVTFSGTKGDQVSIWVRSTQGDAVTWLLDSSYGVVSYNDDADSTTADSHLTAKLSKTGKYTIAFRDYSLASHDFTVSVDRACAVAYAAGGATDESVAGMESLMTFTTAFQIVHGSVPSCLALGDAGVRGQVADEVLAHNNVHWVTNDPVVAQPVASGAKDFLATLVNARQELDNRATMAPPSDPTFQSLYPHVNDLQSGLVGDSQTNTKAYFEFDLHIEAEECSQDAHVRVDTRTGQVVILRALGC